LKDETEKQKRRRKWLTKQKDDVGCKNNLMNETVFRILNKSKSVEAGQGIGDAGSWRQGLPTKG
jgi:hypothetical protein